jgi:hypothetical protein
MTEYFSLNTILFINHSCEPLFKPMYALTASIGTLIDTTSIYQNIGIKPFTSLAPSAA